MGWLFFYAGITKVLNPNWTSAGYLKAAKTFTGFYQWLASPAMLPTIDFLNKWGLTLIGAALILGLFVRFSSVIGAGMMILYYLPILTFPYIGANSYIVDDHIIYAAAFLVLAAFRAGHAYGLDPWCASLPICSKFPKLRKLIG